MFCYQFPPPSHDNGPHLVVIILSWHSTKDSSENYAINICMGLTKEKYLICMLKVEVELYNYENMYLSSSFSPSLTCLIYSLNISTIAYLTHLYPVVQHNLLSVSIIPRRVALYITGLIYIPQCRTTSYLSQKTPKEQHYI